MWMQEITSAAKAQAVPTIKYVFARKPTNFMPLGGLAQKPGL